MITLPQSARLPATRQGTKLISQRADWVDLQGRVIQIGLALYLVPALLIVLAVGGVGMMVLLVGRYLTGLIRGSAD